MVTPTGKDAGFDNQVRLDGGSFGMLREHVAIARQSGDWDVYAAATNQTSQGWRSQSQQNIQFGSLNIGRVVRPGPRGPLHRQRLEHQPGDPRRPDPGPVPGRSAPDRRRQLRQRRPGPQPAGRARLAAERPGGSATTSSSRARSMRSGRTWTTRSSRSSTSRAATMAPSAASTGTARSAASAPTPSSAPGTGPATWTPTSTSTTAERAARRRRGRCRTPTRSTSSARAGSSSPTTWRSWPAPPGARPSATTPASPSRASPTTFNLHADKTYDWLAPRIGLLWQDEAGTQVFANLTRSVEPPNLGSMSPTNIGFAPVAAQEAWTGEIGRARPQAARSPTTSPSTAPT